MDFTKYEYIAPIPYGSTVKNNKIQLTRPSQLVIETALSLYKKNKKILLCGEESFDIPLYKEPVTTHLMKTFLLANKVKEADIFCVGKTNRNTVQQIAALATFQKKHSLFSIPFLILCLPYHKKRIDIHKKAYHLNAVTIPINTLIPSLVTQQTESLFADTFEPTEHISRLLSSLDKKGHYSNFFTALQGPRIVDVVHGKAKILLGRRLAKKL